MVEPDALNECRSLVVKGDIAGDIRSLSEYLNRDFFSEEALFMLGSCFLANGLNGLAAVVTSAAVDARTARGKSFPEALMNLGGAYRAEHRNDIAERIWRDALKRETLPRERAKILTNIAGLFVNEGQPETALGWCDQALREDPKNYGAMANRGLASLELGRWKEGWEGFRYTYLTQDRPKRAYSEIPEWDGTPGKTVIVWGDQGIGDEIFFANSLHDMIQVSRKVILDCHPRLEALFRRSFPEAEVHGTRKHITELDWLKDSGAEAAIALADLPRFFRNSDDDWKSGSYLRAAEANRAPGPRIGISWRGGTKRTRTDLRSLPLAMLEPIIRARPEAQWFSLQYTPEAAREVCEFEELTGLRIAHYPGAVEAYDYDKTASFVASLDLVITVCTSIHHLAGALGIPTWTLIPSRPSWRYGIGGERLPWYGSAVCYRQEADGVWAGPIDWIAADLGRFAC